MSEPTPPTESPVAANTPAPAPSAPVVAPVLPTPRLVTVNGVNWGNILDFTHIFRGFRLAINPAKLTMALLAIMMIYVGGRAFDFVWGPQADRNAISQFAARDGSSASGMAFSADRERRIDALLADINGLSDDNHKILKANPGQARAELKKWYVSKFNEFVKDAAEVRATAEKASGAARVGLSPADIEQQSRAGAAGLLMDRMRRVDDAVGYGIFDTFLKYEVSQFDGIVENTLSFIRLAPPRQPDAPVSFSGGAQSQPVSGGLISRDPDRLWRSDTVAGCIANMVVTGPRWLIMGTGPMQWRPDNADTWGGWLRMIGYRAAYLVSLGLLALLALVVIAFTGAAIARLSALELAGIERAPLRDVFVFATRRLWVFIKAPISPFLILLAIGLVMAICGMVGAIPYVGPVILGAVFIAFLGVAFVLMLLSLGILGGFNLLYPTIAVEGADAFDAMSRSFAYAYSRPWRLAFYSVTSLVYGVLTFLFVSFAVYLILMLTHTFVGWGMDLFGVHYGAMSGVPALETIWPMPRFMQLIHPINWYAMNWPEYLGAILLHFWVFLFITGIGAYVISYYFSSHTIIYLLLRRSVDGQNLREVHLDERGK